MEIRLCAVRLARALRADEVEALLPLLPDERRARFARLSDPTRGHEALVAYAVLRAMLRDGFGMAELPPLARGAHGKPYAPSRPDVCFNLSHTDGAVLVALHDQPIGADIERLRPLSPRTVQRIAGTVTEREFFTRWVRRESRVKWSGEGLTRVHEADAPLSGEHLFYPDTFEGYVACVCTQAEDTLAPIRHITIE